MSKTSSTSTFKDLNLDDDWSNHPTIEWFVQHKKTFLWIFLALIVVLIGASRIITSRTLHAESDFFQAETAFSLFQKEISDGQTSHAISSLEQLDAIMKRRPELKPKYEGSLAQTLLVMGDAPKAEAFAKDIFRRTAPDHLKLYQDYSQTSILIEKGLFAEALPQAQNLQTSLEALDPDQQPLLFLYNQIRLALLYQMTNQPEKELSAWHELQNQPLRSEALMKVNQTFKIGTATLNQYIAEREKKIRDE